MNINRREFIAKSTFAGVALTSGIPLLEHASAAERPSFKLPQRSGEGHRWSPSLADKPAVKKPSFWLAQNGAPKATIIIAKDALDTNAQAAQLLQEYVQKISGATLPISDDSQTVEGAKVLIGRSKALDSLHLDLPSGFSTKLTEEGYVIKQMGDTLVLAGNDHRPKPAYKGSFFAVVEILQRLGCRWFFPGEFGEVYPRSSDISLAHLDEAVKPSLAVRGFWWGAAPARRRDKKLHAMMDRWQMLNRYLPYGSVIPSARDGSIMYPFRKTETRMVDGKKTRVNAIFEDHPEYFALKKDGSRNSHYLDVTNPAVLDITTQHAFAFFEKNPDAIAYPIAPPDGAPTSDDPKSRALNKFFMQRLPDDPHIQDISGSFYWFMNELAKRIKAKYPDKLVTTTAYSGRIRPPENLQLEDNITVHTALLSYSRHHRYDWVTWHTQNRVQLYKRWTALIDKVVERPYYPVFQFNCMVPQLLYRSEAYNIRLIKDMGMCGKEWESRTAFFSEGANNYIRGQLLWNTETDVEALLDDYYTRFFGRAAKAVREFDESAEKLLTRSLVDHHEEERIHEIYLHDDVVRITDNAREAQRLAKDADAKTKQHVHLFGMMATHFRAYSDMRHAEAQLDFALAAKKAQQMIAIEKQVDKINHTFIDSYLEVTDQRKTYGKLGANASAYGKLKQYIAKNNLINGVDGKLVTALPEKWHFKTDPHNDGVYYQWHAQPMDKTWKKIKTTSCWEVQGFQDENAYGYNGFAWYRVQFEMPPNMADKKLTLFLGGLNNEAWVWINHQLAAATTYHQYWKRWKYHSEIDISGFAVPGNNSIAIRIHNDQDAGGIFRRCFIYAPNVE